MGIHTGRPLRADEGYVGVDVHRAARIAAVAHGDQILVSAETLALAEPGDVALIDLGEHRLKDLVEPERIYQLGAGDFGPLMSLSATNLPLPTTPFVGRTTELEDLVALVSDPTVRLVTLVGPGGVGKTRLAIEAATRSADGFLDGSWWVPLAPLDEAAQAPAALARTLGVREEEGVDVERALAARLEGRRALVLFDNAEHLLPGLGDVIARLIRGSDRLTVLVTSRELLRLTAERIVTVDPLTADDAASLFQDRAIALGRPVERDETVDDVCAHLDRLPLALELAAARLRTFSPEQLLERLSGRLDVLKGNRDLDPRQQTLRATIEWSHDLLTLDEQTLFRRLSVFVDGATLEAAEAVCDADDLVLEGLADKSLILRRDDGPAPRFGMLESIADFATERLAASGEEVELRSRHARYFRDIATRMGARLRAGEPEEGPVSVLEADIGDLRAAVDFGLATDDVDLVREVTAALPMYWISRGLYAEGRSWLERALELEHDEDDTRRRLLSALAAIAYAQGDHATAVTASDAAAKLALRLGDATERFASLQQQAGAALMNEDFEAGEVLYETALGVAKAVDNGVGHVVVPAEPGVHRQQDGPARPGECAPCREPRVRPVPGSDAVRGEYAREHGRDDALSRPAGGWCVGRLARRHPSAPDPRSACGGLVPRPVRCRGRRARPIERRGDDPRRHRGGSRGDGRRSRGGRGLDQVASPGASRRRHRRGRLGERAGIGPRSGPRGRLGPRYRRLERGRRIVVTLRKLGRRRAASG